MDHLAANSVLPKIFSYLCVYDVVSCRRVCRTFNTEIERNWKIMAKWPISLSITYSENSICLCTKWESRWSIVITKDSISVNQDRFNGPSFGAIIANGKNNRVKLTKQVTGRYGSYVFGKEFTFDIASMLEGFQCVLEIIDERCKIASLFLTSSSIVSQCLLHPVIQQMQGVKLYELDLKSIPLCESTLKLCNITDPEKIDIRFPGPANSSLFLIKTARSYMHVFCEEVQNNLIEKAIQDWASGELDICFIHFVCDVIEYMTIDLDDLRKYLKKQCSFDTTEGYDNVRGFFFYLKLLNDHQRTLKVEWNDNSVILMNPSELCASCYNSINHVFVSVASILFLLRINIWSYYSF